MVSYLRSNTYQPSIREIGQHFGIRSTKTVSEHLQALADKGFVERDPSRSRGIRILGVDLDARTVSLPCFRDLDEAIAGLGDHRAGVRVALDRQLVRRSGGFMVRAPGDRLGVAESASAIFWWFSRRPPTSSSTVSSLSPACGR